MSSFALVLAMAALCFGLPKSHHELHPRGGNDENAMATATVTVTVDWLYPFVTPSSSTSSTSASSSEHLTRCAISTTVNNGTTDDGTVLTLQRSSTVETITVTSTMTSEEPGYWTNFPSSPTESSTEAGYIPPPVVSSSTEVITEVSTSAYCHHKSSTTSASTDSATTLTSTITTTVTVTPQPTLTVAPTTVTCEAYPIDGGHRHCHESLEWPTGVSEALYPAESASSD